MPKYLIEIEVNEDKLRRSSGIDVGDENEYEESIDSLIVQEMGWLDESGIYIEEIYEVTEETSKITAKDLGTEISDIINQDGDEKTDGQCIDEIIYHLNAYGFYNKRK